MSKNYISLAGDLQIIKKTMTPTEFKGYLKGRVLELRLACAEPDIVVSELQKLIAVYSDELNSMIESKVKEAQLSEDTCCGDTCCGDTCDEEEAYFPNEDKDVSEKETETF